MTPPKLSRRDFVRASLGATALTTMVAPTSAADAVDGIPIIDTHIHLFDPTRPGGVPWPAKSNTILYRPALPPRYRDLAVPLGIRGAIEVECSPDPEDNQWVLDVAAKDTVIVGTVGNLEPGKPDFRRQVERFARNPLFRGIRYGNLWGRDLAAEVMKPEFIADLGTLADAGLVLDTANPTPSLIDAIVRVTDAVPRLRVVIDHLPHLTPPPEPAAREAYATSLRLLGQRPQVYVKISQILRRIDTRVPEDLAFYRDRLEQLWDVFGEDRILYGSDWPNSDQTADYPKVLRIAREWIAGKGRSVAEKYFWKNSVAAYRWIKRASDQPSLV